MESPNVQEKHEKQENAKSRKTGKTEKHKKRWKQKTRKSGKKGNGQRESKKAYIREKEFEGKEKAVNTAKRLHHVNIKLSHSATEK